MGCGGHSRARGAGVRGADRAGAGHHCRPGGATRDVQGPGIADPEQAGRPRPGHPSARPASPVCRGHAGRRRLRAHRRPGEPVAAAARVRPAARRGQPGPLGCPSSRRAHRGDRGRRQRAQRLHAAAPGRPGRDAGLRQTALYRRAARGQPRGVPPARRGPGPLPGGLRARGPGSAGTHGGGLGRHPPGGTGQGGRLAADEDGALRQPAGADPGFGRWQRRRSRCLPRAPLLDARCALRTVRRVVGQGRPAQPDARLRSQRADPHRRRPGPARPARGRHHRRNHRQDIRLERPDGAASHSPDHDADRSRDALPGGHASHPPRLGITAGRPAGRRARRPVSRGDTPPAARTPAWGCPPGGP